MVERLNPLGLNGIKITLDGDRDAHNQARPLRGGQGTFDRIIANTRAVADITSIAVGGNFDVDTADSYPALLDFLAEQDFAPRLSKVTFKPVIREKTAQAKGMIPLTVVGAEGKPLERRVHDLGRHRREPRLRHLQLRRREDVVPARRDEEARVQPPRTACTWVPCEIHKAHAHTVGPDGSLFACPGFAGEALQSTGHIDGRAEDVPHAGAAQLRAAGGVGAVQRLRVHPGLRRRLHGRGAQRARRHARAQLPQDEFPRRCRGDGARRGAGSGDRVNPPAGRVPRLAAGSQPRSGFRGEKQ